MEASIFLLLTAFAGYIIGYLSKGFNITINHTQEPVKEEPKEYNPVHLDTMNEEDRAYLEKNKGKVHF